MQKSVKFVRKKTIAPDNQEVWFVLKIGNGTHRGREILSGIVQQSIETWTLLRQTDSLLTHDSYPARLSPLEAWNYKPKDPSSLDDLDSICRSITRAKDASVQWQGVQELEEGQHDDDAFQSFLQGTN